MVGVADARIVKEMAKQTRQAVAEADAEVEAVAEAKALCMTCNERGECLRGAIDRSEPWGVWGGELFHRGAIVARLPRQTVALRFAQLASQS